MNDLQITNPDKIVYPKQKIKKIQIINYYYDVSNLMLDFLQNRPVSVIRCHQNINSECFFKKHPTTENNNLSTFKHQNEKYFYIKNQTDLLLQAQMGTIEFHSWLCKVKTINKPDVMVFDLDPDKNVGFEKLVDAVLKVKSLLDQLELESFLKTSGGKGYHIVVCFPKTKNWQNFNTFAKQVTLLAEQTWPNLFTSNIRKAERKNKIFVDYLRNSKGATCVAPYSLRARDKATISFPIAWKDLSKIKPDQITIKNYKTYLTKKNPWEDFYKTNQTIK